MFTFTGSIINIYIPKMMQCEYCRTTFPKRYLKVHLRFEHRTNVACMKYTCNFENCNRCFSNYKYLLQHMKRCKHFETVILLSDTFDNVNSYDTTLQINFCDQKPEHNVNVFI